MFHKTIHKAQNLSKHLEQLLENSVENLVLQVSIGREFLSIDQMFFKIDQTGIE